MSQTVHSLNWQAGAIPVHTKGLLKAGVVVGLNIYGAFSFFSTTRHANHGPQPLTSAIGTTSQWTSRNNRTLLWWFHVTTNKSKKTKVGQKTYKMGKYFLWLASCGFSVYAKEAFFLFFIFLNFSFEVCQSVFT